MPVTERDKLMFVLRYECACANTRKFYANCQNVRSAYEEFTTIENMAWIIERIMPYEICLSVARAVQSTIQSKWLDKLLKDPKLNTRSIYFRKLLADRVEEVEKTCGATLAFQYRVALEMFRSTVLNETIECATTLRVSLYRDDPDQFNRNIKETILDHVPYEKLKHYLMAHYEWIRIKSENKYNKYGFMP
jgi:hypothetical protein